MNSEVDIQVIMKEIEEADGKVEFIDESTQDQKFEPLSLFEMFYLLWYSK